MSRAGATYKPRRAKNVCVCAWCRHVFQSTRSDAKTCSPKCRKALSRFTSDRVESVTVTRRADIKINSRGKQEVMSFDRVFVEVKN